ncbi:MAG: hypothetical protein QN189_12025 [Armatimonadota bacterium]|nr:hypothetical protein [Armatimonadota bacterium]MDR7435836.1 hypothetical protein [Armatimonadota bacterium]
MADSVVEVQFVLDEAVLRQVVEVIRAQGWREEEGIRILLGYGFAVHAGTPKDDLLHSLGAARGELATLRHRAYVADESIRALEMNITGLTASLEQGKRSLMDLEEILTSLRAQVQAMAVRNEASG